MFLFYPLYTCAKLFSVCFKGLSYDGACAVCKEDANAMEVALHACHHNGQLSFAVLGILSVFLIFFSSLFWRGVWGDWQNGEAVTFAQGGVVQSGKQSPAKLDGCPIRGYVSD